MLPSLRMQPRLFVFLVGLFAGVSLHVSPAEATWPVDGVMIGGSQARANESCVIPDGSGGWFISWTDHRQSNLTGDDIRLQHLSATGDPAPGWTQQGILVSGGPQDELVSALAPDGQGGVLCTWQDARSGFSWDVYVQRYSSNGVIAPGWPVGGVRATGDPNMQQNPQVGPDGQGGAFVVWEDDRVSPIDGKTRVFGQRITASGAIANGWPTDGLQVCSFYSGAPQILPDGAGGCFVMWGDGRRGAVAPDASDIDVYGQHLLPDGTKGVGWQIDGNLIAQGRAFRWLEPDGAGGVYAASAEFTGETINPNRYWVSRFAPNGVPATGWTLQGVPLQATLGYRPDLHCAADSVGGLLASWDDANAQGGDIYATRILPNGTVAPGWLPNGKPISDPADPTEYTSDVGPDGIGGAFFAWEKHSAGYAQTYVQHVDAQGVSLPGWPLGGIPVSSHLHPQVIPHVSHDGSTSVLVSWLESAIMAQRFVTDGIVATTLALASSDIRSDRVTLLWQGAGASGMNAIVYRRTVSEGWQRMGSADHDAPDRLRYEDGSVVAGTRYAYRLGYVEDGAEQFTAETWIDVPAADVFALDGLRPNPAVGTLNVSFSLPKEGPATMELLDLAGRRVIDREVGQLGRGRHVFRLDSGPRMAPGVYWLRLRQGAQQALTRAVVMR